MGCQRHRNTNYHHRSNGLDENSHRRLKAALRMQVNPQVWHHSLPLVLLSIRNTPKPEIDCCSAELVVDQALNLPGQFVNANDNPWRASE